MEMTMQSTTEHHGTSDHNVTETALDAAKCKLSAATQGYFADDLLRHFVAKPTRRIPLIHRGYYLRHTAITQCVGHFLAAHACTSNDNASAADASAPHVQIVSLGAGFDTLAFRLLQQAQRGVAFVEVDCDAIVREKRDVLTRDAATFTELFTASGRRVASATNSEISDADADNAIALQCRIDALACSYALLACDLGDTARLETLLFDAAGLDRSLPTLVLAECVVSYLAPTKGTALLRGLAHWFTDATAVLYDPLALTNVFGATLQRYFAVKGCELRALRTFQTARDHFQRFLTRARGWQTCRVLDMNAIAAGCTDACERERLASLEVFDEFADALLCNAHYAIFIATNCPSGSNTSGARAGAEPHWSAAFCSGEQVVPHMEANAVVLRAPSDSVTEDDDDGDGDDVIIVRTFEPSDLAATQQLFETTHLEGGAATTTARAVKKFVANRLKIGDMRDVQGAFMVPQHRGGSGARCFWVAEVCGQVVGCVGVKPSESSDSGSTTAELCRLSVDTSMRRRGVGSALVTAVEAFARAHGYARIVLETIGAMASAQQLYRSLRYDEVARESFASFSLVRFAKDLA